MSDTAIAGGTKPQSGTQLPVQPHSRIPVFVLGASLGLFLTLTYMLCVVFDLWFPEYAMYRVWAPLLPGFVWISWPSFFLGLVETFAYGWYVALVFGPIYNLFAREIFRS
jgi:hypothetical protein